MHIELYSARTRQPSLQGRINENVAFGLQSERINDVGEKYDIDKNDIDLYTLPVQYKF
ncbi:hypothetical protein [Zooshikella harenae]|uniref:Uncharacterized protein n=1 Tax=Zooshikella harenae TaxID=2827238 RepID=A0ABS5ZEX2_9GAMM|nr:hypothetical protein [Zooshikella harenae]MBU2712616.1 hypothetical protein [Zooshikella harenae]